MSFFIHRHWRQMQLFLFLTVYKRNAKLVWKLFSRPCKIFVSKQCFLVKCIISQSFSGKQALRFKAKLIKNTSLANQQSFLEKHKRVGKRMQSFSGKQVLRANTFCEERFFFFFWVHRFTFWVNSMFLGKIQKLCKGTQSHWKFCEEMLHFSGERRSWVYAKYVGKRKIVAR